MACFLKNVHLVLRINLPRRVQSKKDSVKDLCKRLNTRIEKVLQAQAIWAMPDDKLRGMTQSMLRSSAVSKYEDFWHLTEQKNMMKAQQKYLKCAHSLF